MTAPPVEQFIPILPLPRCLRDLNESWTSYFPWVFLDRRSYQLMSTDIYFLFCPDENLARSERSFGYILLLAKRGIPQRNTRGDVTSLWSKQNDYIPNKFSRAWVKSYQKQKIKQWFVDSWVVWVVRIQWNVLSIMFVFNSKSVPVGIPGAFSQDDFARTGDKYILVDRYTGTSLIWTK